MVLADVENAIPVEQYIKQKGLIGKVWVCPHLVSNGRIGNPDYLSGVECTVSTIPQEVRQKKVISFFREGGFNCLVWYNDDDYPYKVD